MRPFFSTLRDVQRWEWDRMCHNKVYLAGMLIIPIFILFFFPNFLNRGLPRGLPVALVDHDNTGYTRLLASNLETMDQVTVKLHVSSFAEAYTAMQNGEIYGIVEIPEGFTGKVLSGKRPEIQTYYNGAYIMAGSLAYRDMKMLSEMVNGAVILEIAKARGITEEAAMAAIMPISIQPRTLGNTWLNYSIYLSVMLVPLMLELMVLFMTAYTLGIEIKEDTSHELLERSGGSMTLLILGKLSLHFVVWAIYGLLMMMVFFYYLQFPLINGFWPMYINVLLLILASMALGIFFVGLLPSPRLSLSVSALVGILGFTLSGFTFPVQAMPSPMQSLSYLIPIRHYFIVYIDQALNGAPLHYSMPYYIMLFAFILLPITLLHRVKWAYRDFHYVP